MSAASVRKLIAYSHDDCIISVIIKKIKNPDLGAAECVQKIRNPLDFLPVNWSFSVFAAFVEGIKQREMRMFSKMYCLCFYFAQICTLFMKILKMTACCV